jgi:hypothetical protein
MIIISRVSYVRLSEGAKVLVGAQCEDPGRSAAHTARREGRPPQHLLALAGHLTGWSWDDFEFRFWLQMA